ncbi:MAG: uroporphyrinogen decarboxylase [Gemmatimonadota bacterium]
MPPQDVAEPTFLAACRGRPVPRTPVWIMRQAGRYLPEYRKIREGTDFLGFTKMPELAAEATLQPIRRFDLDAAILFADIMTPVEGMGIELEFDGGPYIPDPVRDAAAVDRLRVGDPEASVPHTLETIRRVREELPASVPLIGFAGAPFTVFCYLVEGRGSRTFAAARAFLNAEPVAARRLLALLTETTIGYLAAQAAAGAQALMLFDSWIGLLARQDFADIVLPEVARILGALEPLGLPLIYFPNQGGHLLGDLTELPADVIGVDWRTPLREARDILGQDVTLQGNLDPAVLFAPRETLGRRIDAVLDDAGSGRHVFNLGHGIDRSTDPDAVAFLVDRVHARTTRPGF